MSSLVGVLLSGIEDQLSDEKKQKNVTECNAIHRE